MKTLLLLRHAKSDWDASYGADHDRPLNDRGSDAARQVGHLVVSLGLVPDLVLSSTAVRARTTAELAIEAGDWDSELVLDRGLYGSGVDEVLDIVATAAAGDLVMIVGHQPTWGSLVFRLTGVPTEIKTATLAVVSLPIEDWGALEGTRGSLEGVHHPIR
jgi:phosphohistidine phosphatase